MYLHFHTSILYLYFIVETTMQAWQINTFNPNNPNANNPNLIKPSTPF
ncbi:hypothetical protein [Acetobacteroides hydrogenigenes]|uniref:Uncharacterized protein n=1 Tax=Acetobacteroides hydrogenigenes TaxID=979970 RepID=A0A4R2E2F5_9BACT|nr:hypothetical protein [Acetobacteroides hydrogenigenes]TCN61631.1 hypothetical protein CLV25_12514 [Acetobacteroides hydrogenigenes]